MQHKEIYQIIEPHAPIAYKYFAFLFNKLPSTKLFQSKIQTDSLKNLLTEQYKETAPQFIENGRFENEPKYVGYYETTLLFAVLKDGLIIEQDRKFVTFFYDERISEEELIELKLAIDRAQQEEKVISEFYMIKKNHYGDFELGNFNIKERNVSVSDYYNDDLAPIHDNLLTFLNEPNTHGIVLFHGVPGSGKTNYIRHLIASCKTNFIYIPNNLFSHLSDPDFIAFISSFTESAIILEDCEELLRSRLQQTADTGIANLLNLGDGLLGDALKLKIICTFNCELSRIDEALLRKGRLAFRYEFGPLDLEKRTVY